MPMYSKKVMEHFQKPHNYGKMKNPDGVGLVGNPTCGDVMKLYIKVGRPARHTTPSGVVGGGEFIKDIKFETFGCAAAIATSSAITDLAKGKTLEQALKIDNKKIVDSLGGLPSIKLHCSVLGAEALKKAIQDYRSKKSQKLDDE